MSNLKATKQNKLPTHIVRAPMETLSNEARRCIGKYQPRVVQPGEAQGRENNLWSRNTYRSGDGDHTNQVPRAGSMVAYSLPSRGLRT